MTAYEIVEFLESLPRSGGLSIEIGRETLHAVLSELQWSAMSDSALRINGRLGWGTWALTKSAVLIDTDTIEMIRHTEDIPT